MKDHGCDAMSPCRTSSKLAAHFKTASKVCPPLEIKDIVGHKGRLLHYCLYRIRNKRSTASKLGVSLNISAKIDYRQSASKIKKEKRQLSQTRRYRDAVLYAGTYTARKCRVAADGQRLRKHFSFPFVCSLV